MPLSRTCTLCLPQSPPLPLSPLGYVLILPASSVKAFEFQFLPQTSCSVSTPKLVPVIDLLVSQHQSSTYLAPLYYNLVYFLSSQTAIFSTIISQLNCDSDFLTNFPALTPQVHANPVTFGLKSISWCPSAKIKVTFSNLAYKTFLM